MPKKARDGYVSKFKTSLKFWHTIGGGLEEITIKELVDRGYKIKRNGISNYTVLKESRIIFLEKIPDDTDDIKTTRDVPSWKRMCYCILKNDHMCRFMGFGLTREQYFAIKTIKDKYKTWEEKENEL